LLRKTIQALLNVKAVDDILPIQSAEATQTMCQLIQDPDGYYDHIRRYSTAVILSSVFGQHGAEFNSPKVRALYHAQEQFTEILETNATPPIDAFPFLRYVPEFLATWKSRAKIVRNEQRSLYISLLEETKARVAKGITTGCFMERMLQDQPKSGLDDEHVAYLGGTLVSVTKRQLLNLLHGFGILIQNRWKPDRIQLHPPYCHI
jgi:hypothetical protein